ncbi:MAG: WYL domain-containing protein [Propionibacteriales bacterium]|nr:WYL domain-containing protein [Propionibacteriales bacterium]
MSANAQDQVARMLALVPYLRARDGIAVEDVARDFGVKPAQIVKDLNVLWFCGLPNSVTGDMIDVDMGALDGEGVVKLTNADYLTRPLRLAPHEALALMVALRALREVSGPGEQDAVDRALVKLEAAAGEASTKASTVDIQIDPVDTRIRVVVDQALREHRQLDLLYYVPGRDETTQRAVSPMRLIFSEGHGYLEAWCHRVDEVRMFRLDRMIELSLLDTPAAPRENAHRADLSRGLFQPDDSDPLAVIDLAPAAGWVADYYPIERVEEVGGGHLRVGLRFSSEGWLERLVLRLGGGAELIEPVALADRVRQRAADALAQYSPPREQ